MPLHALILGPPQNLRIRCTSDSSDTSDVSDSSGGPDASDGSAGHDGPEGKYHGGFEILSGFPPETPADVAATATTTAAPTSYISISMYIHTHTHIYVYIYILTCGFPEETLLGFQNISNRTGHASALLRC